MGCDRVVGRCCCRCRRQDWDTPNEPGGEETTMAYDEELAARIREVLAEPQT